MGKINITKPTGSDTFNLLSAFKENEETYIIFDSERTGSMGLPIIYISKYTDKLEKITDENEWQSVKNYLKGIINGTNFHYVAFSDNVNADEAYYTPLTLPQASFDLIKSRYVVTDNEDTGFTAQVLGQVPTTVDVQTQEPVPTVPTEAPAMPEVATPNVTNVPPVDVVMPNNNVQSNMTSSIPTQGVEPAVTPQVTSVSPVQQAEQVVEPVAPVTPVAPVQPAVVQPAQAPSAPQVVVDNTSTAFLQDKETFLKACENMFDALVSKYQKQLRDVEAREQELLKKEQEINTKLHDANEHLANAAAREQVANIAHDNAQKVMDMANMMPNNPTDNQTGVI